MVPKVRIGLSASSIVYLLLYERSSSGGRHSGFPFEARNLPPRASTSPPNPTQWWIYLPPSRLFVFPSSLRSTMAGKDLEHHSVHQKRNKRGQFSRDPRKVSTVRQSSPMLRRGHPAMVSHRQSEEELKQHAQFKLRLQDKTPHAKKLVNDLKHSSFKYEERTRKHLAAGTSFVKKNTGIVICVDSSSSDEEQPAMKRGKVSRCANEGVPNALNQKSTASCKYHPKPKPILPGTLEDSKKLAKMQQVPPSPKSKATPLPKKLNNQTSLAQDIEDLKVKFLGLERRMDAVERGDLLDPNQNWYLQFVLQVVGDLLDCLNEHWYSCQLDSELDLLQQSRTRW